MKIKNIIYASCASLLVLGTCGCENKEEVIDKPIVNEVKEIKNLDKEEVKEETPVLEKVSWETVRIDYENIERKAPKSVNKTYEDLINLVNSLNNDFNIVKNGITKKNENTVKNLYRNACVLSNFVNTSEEATNLTLISTVSDIKEFVERLYDNDNTSISIENITWDFETIYSYTEEDWINLFQ